MNGSPQTEEGFTAIASELIEALVRHNLNGAQWRVFLAIARKTYGWNKKTDTLSMVQISIMTGISRPHVVRAFSALKVANICTQAGTKIGINKMYSTWKLVPKRAHRTQAGTMRTQAGTKSVPKRAHTIEDQKHYTKAVAEKFPIEDKMRYEQLCKLLTEMGLQNSVNPKLYITLCDEYSRKFITWPEVKNCAFWTRDKGNKILTASRLRNWFEKKKTWDKEKQLKNMTAFDDKKNKDPFRRSDYEPPVDMDLTQ